MLSCNSTAQIGQNLRLVGKTPTGQVSHKQRDKGSGRKILPNAPGNGGKKNCSSCGRKVQESVLLEGSNRSDLYGIDFGTRAEYGGDDTKQSNSRVVCTGLTCSIKPAPGTGNSTINRSLQHRLLYPLFSILGLRGGNPMRLRQDMLKTVPEHSIFPGRIPTPAFNSPRMRPLAKENNRYK